MWTKIRFFSLYLFLFFLWCTGEGWGQSQVNFKRFTVQNGLSHDYIRNILQDSEGFIWIATQDGLNKFDSHSFYVYKNNHTDQTTLFNHSVMSLAEDNEQNIWVGTWGGGLYRYNRKKDTFQQFIHIENQSASLSSDYIYDIYFDTKGYLWVGTNSGSLDRIHIQTHTCTHYTHSDDNPNSLINNRVVSITEDAAGNIWLGTLGGGVDKFNVQKGIFTHYTHSDSDTTSLSGNDVCRVFIDNQQRVWVGTWENGLNMLENSSGHFRHFRHNDSNPHSLSNDQIWSITQTPNGKIWIGTDNGLSVYNDAEDQFYIYKNDPFDSKSLTANSIKTLYTDHQGRLWVGTINSGLCMFDKSFVQMGHQYKKLDSNSLSYNDVSAFLEMPDGKLLIGTDGGGLNVYDRKKNSYEHYIHQSKNPHSISSNKVKSLLLDSQKRIWVGFWDGGFDLFDFQKHTFTHFRKTKTQSTSALSSNNVICITEDADGYLWLGTFGGGINQFDPVHHTFISYTHDPEQPHSLSDKYVWAVLADRTNRIWVGTSNGKLDLLDRKTHTFIHIPLQKTTDAGYAIRVLFEDSKGRLWIGLEGGGLKQIHTKDWKIDTFTQANGLPGNNVHAIEEDTEGFLWLSTNQGIARFDPNTRTCKTFGLSDGLQGLQFNRQASASLRSGELAFGGNNGFNLFNPQHLKPVDLLVPLVFTDFQIFNKPVPIGTSDSPLSNQINETTAITLSYKQSVFSIEYAALNYIASEKIQYIYRLRGFVDDTWQAAGTTRKVTYTNLAPGSYIFEVATVTGTNTTASLRKLFITITPPWWKTWWFRILAIGLTSFLLGGLYYLRIKNVQHISQRLEKEVNDRTQALQQANAALLNMNALIQEQKEKIESQTDELTQSNNEIRSINQQLEERVEHRTAALKKANQELDNFVYRVSHDIRAPLSSVMGLVGLIENENNPDQARLYLKMVVKSIHKLDGFVKDILDYARNTRLVLDTQKVDFIELLDNIKEELQYMENAQKQEVILDFNLSHPHYNDPKRLHIIFRNLLSNAVKYQNPHEDHPYVRIHITTHEKDVVIVVADNGIGIAAPQQEKVFQMFYRGSELSSGSGIGLYIVKETVEKLEGTIELISAVGKGSQFTVRLPSLFSENTSL